MLLYLQHKLCYSSIDTTIMCVIGSCVEEGKNFSSDVLGY